MGRELQEVNARLLSQVGHCRTVIITAQIWWGMQVFTGTEINAVFLMQRIVICKMSYLSHTKSLTLSMLSLVHGW